MSYTKEVIERMNARAAARLKQSRRTLKELGRLKPGKLDQLMQNEHRKEFNKINCLECANCCKTISPSISDSDVRRMATAVKMKTPAFIDMYLKVDKDQDFVFKQTPCPFLGDDNFCMIYTSRPKACREYPHTDRRRFYQILNLTARNTLVCPAVFAIVERLGESDGTR